MAKRAFDLKWRDIGPEHVRIEAVDFDLRDARGRMIGGTAEIQRWGDGKLLLIVQATRNGVKFGGTPASAYVESLDQGKALASEKLEAMRKRYARLVVATGD